MVTDINQLDFNKIYSYSDYLTWQFEERLELIKGRIFKMSPAPSMLHQRVSGRIYGEFFLFLKNKKCEAFNAPFDVRLIDKKNSTDEKAVFTVVQPDICIVCDESKLDRRGCVGAPDLIVEIISKGTKKKDLNEKFHLYAEAGVLEYWIVYPNEGLISVFELKNEKYELRKIYTDEEKVPAKIFSDCKIDLLDIFY